MGLGLSNEILLTLCDSSQASSGLFDMHEEALLFDIRHARPSDMLVYDLQFRLRCQGCDRRGGVSDHHFRRAGTSDSSKPRLERVIVAGGVRGCPRNYACHQRAPAGIVGSMMSWIKPMSFACWGFKVVPVWIISTTLSRVSWPSVPSAIASAIIC